MKQLPPEWADLIFVIGVILLIALLIGLRSWFDEPVSTDHTDSTSCTVLCPL